MGEEWAKNGKSRFYLWLGFKEQYLLCSFLNDDDERGWTLCIKTIAPIQMTYLEQNRFNI